MREFLLVLAGSLGSLIVAAASYLIQHLLQQRSNAKAHERQLALQAHNDRLTRNRETADRRTKAYDGFIACYERCLENLGLDPEEIDADLHEEIKVSLRHLETCASSDFLALAQIAVEEFNDGADWERLEELREQLVRVMRREQDL